MRPDAMKEDTPTTARESPRFCPDCGRAAGESWPSPLCDHCGGTLAAQGYCPICESRLRRRVGESCPKHDVELLADEPSPEPQVAEGSTISWVTVKRFPDSLAATGARIRLDAEGIPTFLEGERMGAPAMYRVATGGVKLQVPAELAAEARIILAQDWSWPEGEPELDEGSAADEMETTTPDAGATRTFLIEMVLALSLAIVLLAVLLAQWRGG